MRYLHQIDVLSDGEASDGGGHGAGYADGVLLMGSARNCASPMNGGGLKTQLSFSYSDGFGREIQKKIQAEPGPLVEGGPIASPRWVGSGWTIFNNKGKPVRQYEPFFSKRRRPDGTLFSDHRFEFGVMTGVSPVLFYDPAERVIATLHPNHTYEKVVFDPWQQTTYDVNDTCAARNLQTGDPRTDPDIQGFVGEYFKTQPATWQTWHAQRVSGTMGTHERDAAQRAVAHADTPTTAHFDTLGRPFLTVARNRVVCPGHDLDGSEDSFATRVDLDIEGNQRAVRDAIQQAGDALGRIVMRYAYDMLGNRIHQLSMEAGARWMLNDVTGKPIRAWDSRGHTFTTTYDALRRPIEQTVRGTSADSDPRTLNRHVLADRIEYGEGIANAEALNLRTRIYRHFDSTGVATNARLDANGNPTEAYDFKGNLLRSTRRLVSDYKTIPDWLLSPRLENENFEGGTRYDALNRPIQSITPHSTLARAQRRVIQPVFNEANLLERVDVWLERADEPGAPLDPNTEPASPVGVANIDYDAKGQRLRVNYKNGATARYGYDPETFRLVHLYTKRGAAFTDDCDNPAPPPPTIAAPDTPAQGKACGLQNLHYTYDPAGNITHIRDDAQQTIYFHNRRVEPSSDYVYDAVYRLIQATGREHLGQGGAPVVHSHNDEGRVGLVSADAAGRFAPNDGNAMDTYTERYVYDAVGNFLQMQHRGSDPAHAGWTRRYAHNETSLIEGGKQNNRLSSTQVGNGVAAAPETYLHDAHGNMIRMPHLVGGQHGPNMHWDYKDQLRQVDKGGGGTAYYVYDASGQRVRKVWEKAPGLIEERIYLNGVEIFRKHGGLIGANTATLERATLHVMDDTQRIALVETRTLDTTGTDVAPPQLIRFQLGNHLGSASLELDEHAQIISYEEYAPYGSSTYQAVRSQTETPKRYRYTGKERDEESGLSYHGARYYAQWLARWTACDPAGPVDGLNLYRYCEDKPVLFIDDTGGSQKKFNVGSRYNRGIQHQADTATGLAVEQNGRVRVGKQVGANRTSIVDHMTIREDTGGDLRSHEAKSLNASRYREDARSLDESKLRRRAQRDLRQVEKHIADTGLSEDLHIFTVRERSAQDVSQVRTVYSAEAAKRGINVTVRSLETFIKSQKPSNFGKAVGVLAAIASFLGSTKVNAAEQGELSPLPENLREIVDAITPDSVSMALDFGQLVRQADDISLMTARKIEDLAYVAGLQRVQGTTLMVNTRTGELFGLETSALRNSEGIPGALTPIGKMRVIPPTPFTGMGGALLSADETFGFVHKGGGLVMQFRVGGEWIDREKLLGSAR